MYKKMHLQVESVCKQVISDYHAGKVHLELLQGKRGCTLYVFNAQVSRIISTSVLQQHLHPTITWKWLHPGNLGKKLLTQHSNQIFKTKSKSRRGGGSSTLCKKNSSNNVDLARYQKTCKKKVLDKIVINNGTVCADCTLLPKLSRSHEKSRPPLSPFT